MSNRLSRLPAVGKLDVVEDRGSGPEHGPVIDQHGVTQGGPVQRHGPGRPIGRSRPATSEEIEIICRAVGVEVTKDAAKLAAVVETMDVAREQTSKILSAGVQIGRALVDAERELSPEEFRALLRSGRDLLSGWSQGNLVKMQGAARFVDSGRVSPDRLPQSYTVLYQLSRLEQDELEYALEHKLVHPGLTRGDAEGLRRHGARRRLKVPDEAEKLDRQIESLVKRLKLLRQRRAELSGGARS